MKRIASLVLLVAVGASAGAPSSWIRVAGGVWDPDEAVLKNLSSDIQSYVTSEAVRRDAKLSGWDTYRFQYQGRLAVKKRIVFVNGFCHTFGGERLETEFFFVPDGGPCYFNLEYDPATRKFSSLRFNGYG